MTERPTRAGHDEVVIGIDVGTTATKVVAFPIGAGPRAGGFTPDVVSREYPLLEPTPGWQVQNPAAVAAAVVESLRECASRCTDAKVLAVAVSTAMHGLLGLDERGVPLTPVVTWADGRAREQARWLRDCGLAADLYARSGTPVHPMTPLTKLMWFNRHEPELAARVRWWVGLKDFVLATLTGTLVTELSSASGTGLLDLDTRTWDPEAVDLAGITVEQLPTVLPTTGVLELCARVAERTGLPGGLPVVTGAGDGPLGNLGVGALDPGVVGLSLGTSGAVRMLVPRPLRDAEGRLFCYALTDDQWVLGAAVSNGGSVVRWAAEVFGSDLAAPDGGSADAELLALAEAVPAGSDGMLMLPYLLPERAPLWDPDLPGAFLGVRRGHGRGHFVRAAVEGVALQLSTLVDRLDRLEPVTSVRATGGPFQSPLWRRVVAGVLGRPVTVVGETHGTALGAAALGLLALGRAADLSSARTLLDPAGHPGPHEIPPESAPSEAELAAYARLRSSVPSLVTAYGEVAELFAQPRPGTPAGPRNGRPGREH